MGNVGAENLFAGSGEIASMLRSHFINGMPNTSDWQIRLGEIETWSFSLKNAFSILVNSCCPTFLVWNCEPSQSNPTSKILFYNDAYLSLLKENHHFIPFGESIHANWTDQWSRVRSSVEQVFATGQPLQCQDEPFPTQADHTPLIFTWSYTPVWDETGRVVGTFATGLQVTARQTAQDFSPARTTLQNWEAETTIAATETRFQNIADYSPIMIWISAPDGAGVWFNRQWYEFTGQTVEEALGNGWLTAVHPEDAPTIEQSCLQAHQNHEIVQLEYRLRRQDGEYRWVFDSAVPWLDHNGTYHGYIGSVVDITDRKQAEAEREQLLQALIAEQTRFEAVLRQMPEGVMIADAASGNLILANERTNQMLQYAYELNTELEVYEQKVPFQAYHPNGQPYKADEYPLVRSLRTGEIVTHEEMELRYSNHSHLLLEVNSSPIFDSNGQITAAVAVFQDITHRKQAEIALRRSEEQAKLSIQVGRLGTWRYNPQTNLVELDERMREIWGEPADAAVFPLASVMQRIHPDDREQVAISMSTALAPTSPGMYEVEYRILWDDGTQRWISANGQAQFAGEGAARQPIDFFGTALDITDRKHSEAALLAQEQRYRYIFEAVGVSIWEEDFSEVKAAIEQLKAAGVQDFRQYFSEHPEFLQQAIDMVHLRDVNQASLTLFGAQDKAELLNSLHQIFTPETQAVFVEELLTIAAEETYYAAETVLQTLQGERLQVWFAINFPPPSEPYDRVLVSLLDIRERQQAKANLQQREAELRLVTNTVPALISFVDSEQRYRFNNEKYETWFGHSPAAIYGKHLREVLGETGYEAIRPYVEQVLAGQEVTFESQVAYKDGGTRYISATYVPQFSREGAIEGFVALVNDVSESKQAEAALRESEERYRYLAESIPQLVWTANAEGVLLDVNQRWLEFTGLTLTQAQTEGWEAVVHPEDIPVLSQQWVAAQHNGTYYQAEGRMRQADGGYRWHLHQAVPLKNEQGQVIKWFGTATDIEDQKQLEQERNLFLQRERSAREAAETANRIKDEFLAVLSHELRSPLNPILGWVKLLQTRQFDAAATKRALETIERNAKLQTQLIDDLLDVSRILQGKMALNVCPVDLRSVIDAALETVRLSAEAKRIDLRFEVSEWGHEWQPGKDDENPSIHPIQVVGDFNRLQQVVWNLLSNAVKFTPNGGQIKIQLHQVGTEAQIQVSDTGKGITPEFLPHVFEYFRQEDGSTTRKFGGLGLGLAIVRYLIEQHGGTVQVESPGENLGATFTVRLPLLKDAGKKMKDENGFDSSLIPHPSSLPLSGFKLLVVDDEADMRELLLTILEQSGAEVKVTSSATEALDAITLFNPNLLISDIGMPYMDGYELIHRLRISTAEPHQQIPAIALTAYAGEIDQQHALAAGFQKHLAKPVEPAELVETIVDVIHSTKNTIETAM
jgi:PAS domain S-box-containing protein